MSEQNFYKNFLNEGVYLIQPPSTAPTDIPDLVKEPAPDYQTSGMRSLSHKAETLILLKEDPGPLKGLLDKILESVKLTPQETTIQIVDPGEKTSAFKNNQHSKIISFGVTDEGFYDFNKMVPYQVGTYQGSKLLLADTLQVLQADQEKKKKLWFCLKILFKNNN